RESVSLALGVHAFRDEVTSETLGDHDELTSALSLELAARRDNTATASLGLRGDRLPGGDFVVAPALSAGWWVTPALRLRGSVGKSHRSPTWTERFYRDPVNEGSPTLEVERAWTVDAGAELHPLPGLRI